MRRLPALLLIVLLPFAAAGQSVSGDNAQAEHLLAQPQAGLGTPGADLSVPLWRGPSNRVLVLKADSGAAADPMSPLRASWNIHPGDAGSMLRTGLQYGVGPLTAHAEVSQRAWLNQNSRIVGSEVGATYDAGNYSVGLSVGTASASNRNVVLPRVLPGAAPGVDGLSAFDSSNQLNARGRLALGNKSGLDLGASVGRVYLLPGNLLGVNVLDQKALSFGVDHGRLSGVVTGRTMQPEAGIPGGLYTDKRWNSIDLGVTWRLPWRGSLSVGAQNLWSSGSRANTPAGPEPDQSRTPYVQYHQDL
ncbi:MAG: hypothetical protein EPN69_13135 [Rhodanobacter sp.]|nr:MAG: hypothetical protein EPN69_13135 [Rhodanobacter sp.]TAM07094.1 MAG: hypothetical protein EPN71_00360 [Rhodanobacter sp.]TAM40232.1 MAG: hypothetical protein EPN58_11000 [Rhodanobacter sp.]TAN27065.1 MAG: hypothetical protein EPN32_05125 [Rhodanobacter sp.]